MHQRQQKATSQKKKQLLVTKKPVVSPQQAVRKKSTDAKTKKTMPQVKQVPPTLKIQSRGVTSLRKKKDNTAEETRMKWTILRFTLILFPTLILLSIITLIVTKNLEVVVFLILIAFIPLHRIVCYNFPTNSGSGTFTALSQVITTFLKKH